MADGGRNLDEVPTATAGMTERGLAAANQLRPTHWNALSESERAVLVKRLAESANPDGSAIFINQLDDIEDVRYLLDEDVSVLNRLTEWRANPEQFRHIDADVTASEFVHVARNGDIDNVRDMIVRGTDDFQNRGSVQWLETGDSSKGLKHINQRHATDDQFYAMEGIENLEDVKEAIFHTTNHGNAHRIPENDGGGTAYVHQYTSDKKVTVIVGDNGFIVSARPGGYP